MPSIYFFFDIIYPTLTTKIPTKQIIQFVSLISNLNLLNHEIRGIGRFIRFVVVVVRWLKKLSVKSAVISGRLKVSYVLLVVGLVTFDIIKILIIRGDYDESFRVGKRLLYNVGFNVFYSN